jgi:vitamin B12 transporter
MSQIERIEILTGSQSTLYGSNAVAGVINIITKKPESNQTEGNALLSYGTYNTLKGDLDFNKKGKVFEYDLNYQYLSTDGISEAKDTTSTAFPKNGFIQNAFQAKLGINVTDRLKISPYYRYSNFNGTFSNGAFEGASNPFNSTLQNTGLMADYNYAKGSIHVNYGYDYTNSVYTYNDSTNYIYRGGFNHAEAWVNHRFSSSLQLVGGFSFESYKVMQNDTVNSLFSPYATLLFSKGSFHFELGGRYNHDNKFGNDFTYSINPSYLIAKKIKLFTNLSTGFRVPSLTEVLAYPPYTIGNPGLTPEKSVNVEAGLQAWLLQKKISLTAMYFNRTINNAIIYYTDPVTYIGQYINRDKYQDHGAEIEMNYKPSQRLSFKASYAYIYGTITQKLSAADDTTYYDLVRRPKNTFNLFAGYQVNKHLFISTSLQSFGKRTDNSFDPLTYAPVNVSLHAYALWNAYVEYRILRHGLVIFIDAKNLTNNTNYYEAYGYSVQGFTCNGGVKIKL